MHHDKLLLKSSIASFIVLCALLGLTQASALTTTCTSGEAPKATSLTFCSEWSKISCCSAADDADIQAQVNALVDSAVAPLCHDAIRKLYCGTRCDQWSAYFAVSPSSSPSSPLSKVCGRVCVELRNSACGNAPVTNPTIFDECHQATSPYFTTNNNCFGSGFIPTASPSALSLALASERPSQLLPTDHRVQDPLDPEAGWEGFTIVIASGLLLIVNIVLAAVYMPCCGKCAKPLPPDAYSDSIRIAPAGVPFTLEHSTVTMAHVDNPALGATSLEADPRVQRGAILRRPAKMYTDILFSFFIISDVLLLAVELAPYYLIHVSIRDFTGRPFAFQRDLLYACILMTFTCSIGFYAFLALSRTSSPGLPVWPLRVYIILASLTIPIFALFTYRGFDESIGWYYSLTRTSNTPYVSGAIASMYTWTCSLAFSIGQLIGLAHALRLVAWAEVDPSLCTHPGLPVSFDASEKHRFLLYLDASHMNTKHIDADVNY